MFLLSSAKTPKVVWGGSGDSCWVFGEMLGCVDGCVKKKNACKLAYCF